MSTRPAEIRKIKPHRVKKTFYETIEPWLFLLPALCVFGVFLYFPFFKTLYLSTFLTNKFGQAKIFYGLKNYADILYGKYSREFWNSIWVTVRFVFFVAGGGLLVGLCTSLITVNKFPGKALASAIYAMPIAIASSAAAMSFKMILHKSIGLLNHLLGTSINWLSDTTWTFPIICILSIWLASGINVALRAATGDAVIRLDAHARMPKDFLQKNLDALARGEDIVGGSVCGAPPETAWEAVTRALDTSRFCGGAAPFRNGGEARYVDTLAYALYRREVYDRVGLYDERLRRTEDNDMHYRMRKAGYRFFFSPDIVSWHAARKTLRGQLSQKWGNGYWIGRTMRIQPRCFAPRHLVPALFVLALIVLALLCPLSPLPLAAMLLLYGALDVLYAAKAALEAPCGKLLTFICLPFLFPVVHIVYGTGTLCGLLTGKAESHA